MIQEADQHTVHPLICQRCGEGIDHTEKHNLFAKVDLRIYRRVNEPPYSKELDSEVNLTRVLCPTCFLITRELLINGGEYVSSTTREGTTSPPTDSTPPTGGATEPNPPSVPQPEEGVSYKNPSEC